MNIETRSKLLSGLHKVQGDLFALQEICRVEQALQVGVSVQTAINVVNEALDDFKPEPQQFQK